MEEKVNISEAVEKEIGIPTPAEEEATISEVVEEATIAAESPEGEVVTKPAAEEDMGKKKKWNAEQIIPVITFVIGVIWLAYGLPKYGWFDAKGPTLGFLPLTCAGLMVILSVVQFFRSFKVENNPKYLPESFLIWTCLLAVWGGSFLIGTLPCLVIFFVLWLKLFEKEPWLKTIILTVVFFVLIYFIFVKWIAVPFKQGILIEKILYR